MKDFEKLRKSVEAAEAERLRTMPLEQRLKGLTPEQRLAGLKPRELARILTPEWLAGLSPEQLAQLLERVPEALRASKKRASRKASSSKL